MNQPNYRAVDRLTGDVVPPPLELTEQYLRTIALASGLGETTMAVTIREIDDMRTELAKAKADAEELRDLLAKANQHNASLSKTLDRYGLEIVDLRDSCAEQSIRVQELTNELAEARAARDTANARASL